MISVIIFARNIFLNYLNWKSFVISAEIISDMIRVTKCKGNILGIEVTYFPNCLRSTANDMKTSSDSSSESFTLMGSELFLPELILLH